MKIEIDSIDNGCLVTFTPNFIQGSRTMFYPDWNEGIAAAQHLLEEQKYEEDESIDTSEKRSPE